MSSTKMFNFSPGPAVLPKEVLQQAADEMLDWHGSGMSVMEMSHRGAEYTSIIEAAEQDLRDLLAVPENYKILFMQGGAKGENAIIPLNLLGMKSLEIGQTVADYVNTGIWSKQSLEEAKKYCNVNVAAEIIKPEVGQTISIPATETWQLSADPAFVHFCSNETIDGIEFQLPPNIAEQTNGAPLVADMSSQILSRVIDVSQYGVIYGGAQKNIGPAGLTIVIVREDLLGHALPICPSAFNWKIVADNQSMYNTPPTYSIYIAGLVFQWLKRQGGVAAIEKVNIAKATMLYDYIDSTDYYENRIAKECRSRMNIPFYLKDESLNAAFLAEAKEQGLLQLRGHKLVGGMRASIYNAMPIEGVKALVQFMKNFAEKHA
jgi:phosphoserine aminotransferase